jgi:anti-sigma factor RsiW
MNCEKISKLLIPCVDGKATAAERREVNSHLAGCAVCRARVDEFGKLSSVLGELPFVEPSFGFDAQLRARIASAEARPNWLSWLVPSPRLTCAMGVLLVLSVWFAARPLGVGSTKPLTAENQFQMINNLPVLEDYDVVSNFDALSDLPIPPNPTSDKNVPQQKGSGDGKI